jgi:hypothetical protein
MTVLVRKPRSGDAGLPTNVLASADGDCGGAFVGQIAGTLQAANAARPRRAHIFERDAEGHYVEPLWCSARLFEAESFGAPGASVLDPACGWGRIPQAAKAAGYAPIGSDIVDRRGNPHGFADFQFSVCDFLHAPVRSVWSIVCNPPFDHVEDFCRHALDEIAIFKVAMLVPLRRIAAAHWLQRLPFETVYLLTPRPSMPPADWIGTQDFRWSVLNKQAAIGREPSLRWLHRDRGRTTRRACAKPGIGSGKSVGAGRRGSRDEQANHPRDAEQREGARQWTEGWLICGRRAGKSFILALVAVYLACFHQYRQYLAPGERGTIMVIACDRRQARTIFRYIGGLLTKVPMLARMVEREVAEGFDLTNDVSIEVAVASFRSLRGYTIVAALLDELAFWRTDESANPDSEIISAIRPAMATIPNAMLLCASSLAVHGF